MNRTIRSLVATAAATAALVLIPLAATAAPASAATAAPDPCATPMAFTGIGSGTYASHVFYRARCSSPAVPLDSIDPYTGGRPVLMPDGGHVVSVGISSSQDPNAVDGSTSLAITDIATDRWPGSSRGHPRANPTSSWPGPPPGYAAWQEPTSR